MLLQIKKDVHVQNELNNYQSKLQKYQQNN